VSIYCQLTSNFALLGIFVVAYHSPSTRLNTENKWIELNILVGRQTMKNLLKFSAAVAAIAGVASVATAQSVVPFDYTNTIDGGTVVIGGTPPAGTIVSVAGVTTTLSSGLPAAFASGVYTFDYSSLTSYLSVKDSVNTIVLEGNVNIIGNSVFSATNPSFLFLGSVTYTGGTWLDAVRIATAGAASGQTVTGELGLSGLPSGRVGVDQVYLSASAVPEPGEWAAMGMLASGLGGLVIRARRRKLA
jgi:hypothetical protein